MTKLQIQFNEALKCHFMVVRKYKIPCNCLWCRELKKKNSKE